MPARDEYDPTIDDSTDDSPHASRPKRRRRIVMAGAAGVTAALGVTAYLVGDTSPRRLDQSPEPAAIAPLRTESEVPRAPATTVASPHSRSVTGSPDTTTTPEETARATAESVDGTDTGEKEGNKPAHRKAPKTERPFTAVTERLGDSTVSITSADYDLTGKGQLRWAADRGSPVGDARCTHKFRFDPAKGAQEKSDLVLCWRTSSRRSVVAFAFGQHHNSPSAASTVEVLNKHWAEKD